MKFNKKNIVRFLSLSLLLVGVFTMTACDKGNEGSDDFLDLSVRDYVGENGVVTAASPYAAKAGLDILKAGGNAFDAAVAVSFALGVVEPHASGIGGGGILVGYDALEGEYVSYNFREFVPAAGTAAIYGSDANLDDNVMSCGVPTQVAGLLKIEEDRGALTRQEVMAPAIKYAKDGITVTPGLASVFSENFAQAMKSREETLSVFTSDGIEVLVEGDLLIQPDYANVLQKISDEGAVGFYTGSVADAIVESMQTHEGATESDKGLITHEDLLFAMNNYPKIATPIYGTYNGFEFYTASTPSSGGIILLETLNMLEHYSTKTGKTLASLGHNSAEYLNVVATAMAAAYGDKRQYIADETFINVPIEGLLSKAYAADRWDQIYTEGSAWLGRHAAGGSSSSDYGNPKKYMSSNMTFSTETDPHDYIEHYSTTSFSIADKDGNIVSVTQTINHFFGNGVVPKDCGFFLNNQLSSFSLTPSSVHYVEPYKQPVSHIMPTIIMKDGQPWATLGTPGGLRIPSAIIQVVLNLIEFDMDIQSAIASPRIYSYAAANGDYGGDGKRDLYIEGASLEMLQQLEAMNYFTIPYDNIDLFFGGVHGIRFISDSEIHGGADPRRDGKALGY